MTSQIDINTTRVPGYGEQGSHVDRISDFLLDRLQTRLLLWRLVADLDARDA